MVFSVVLINKKLNWQVGRIELLKDFYFLKLTLSKFLISLFKKNSLLTISMLLFFLIRSPINISLFTDLP